VPHSLQLRDQPAEQQPVDLCAGIRERVHRGIAENPAACQEGAVQNKPEMIREREQSWS